jgi:hypothetical protein
MLHPMMRFTVSGFCPAFAEKFETVQLAAFSRQQVTPVPAKVG